MPDAVPPTTAISLEGRHVRLRPITRADYGFLWECRCHPDILYLWMSGRTLPSFEQYVYELETAMAGTILTMLVVETRTNPHPVGFVFAYEHNVYDRNVFWSVAVHPAYTNVGWGAEASLLFLDYLFAFFDLRKVSSEVYAFNEHSLRLLLRMGAHEEGRFLGHRYYQGAYHDVVRLAATRADWERARIKLTAILARRTRNDSESRAADARHSTTTSQNAAGVLADLEPVMVTPATFHNGNGHGTQ
jgi:RimJ/RimL family protein N-acetyltransferase